ncbi:mCG145864, isoform CRA_a, partial [Mus musculus]
DPATSRSPVSRVSYIECSAPCTGEHKHTHKHTHIIPQAGAPLLTTPWAQPLAAVLKWGVLCYKTVRVVDQTMWSQCVQVMNGVTHAASSTNDRELRGRSLNAQFTSGDFYTQLLFQRKPFL